MNMKQIITGLIKKLVRDTKENFILLLGVGALTYFIYEGFFKTRGVVRYRPGTAPAIPEDTMQILLVIAVILITIGILRLRKK